jgi:hypothetical protein
MIGTHNARKNRTCLYTSVGASSARMMPMSRKAAFSAT